MGSAPMDLYLCCRSFLQLLSAAYDCMAEDLDLRFHPEKIKVGSQAWVNHTRGYSHLRS